MALFLMLPLEIWIMIYKYCLVVGKVFPYTLSEPNDEPDYTFKDTKRVSLGYEVPEVQNLDGVQSGISGS